MISTLTSSGAGPISCYIATGGGSFSVFSSRTRTIAASRITGTAISEVYRVAWGGNRWLGVAEGEDKGSGSNNLRVFDRSGSTFTSVSVPSNFDQERGDCGLSSDGAYIAASSTSSPYGRIWYNNNGTLTALTSVGSFSTNTRACAVSSDGKYVAFLGNSTFLRIKERTGSGTTATYADMTLASQPTSGASSGTTLAGLAFSPNDVYLAVAPSNEDNACIYKFNSGTSVYEKLASPFSGSLPAAALRGCAFDPAGEILALATSGTTVFYERSSDTFTNVATISNGGNRGNFHPTGNYYITGNGRIYKKNSASSWTELTQITAGNTAAFSPTV
jgi:WD40 repeat protein